MSEMQGRTGDASGNPERGPGYETTDVSGRFVARLCHRGDCWSTVVVAGDLVDAVGDVGSHRNRGSRNVSPLVAREKDRLPAQPRLEGIEPSDLARNRQAANDKILHSYGWVDEKRQIVRIPIDRAMEIAAETLKGVSKKAGVPSSDEFEMPRVSNSGRRMKKEVSP